MLDLDLSNVKDSGSFQPLPAGEYNLIVDEAEVKQTKAGTGEYINLKLKVLNGQYAERFIFTTFNFKNANKQAQDIGMSQLKGFLGAAGMNNQKLSNVVDMVGAKAVGVVKIKHDEQWGDKNVVSYFKPYKKENDSLTAGAPKKSEDVPF